MKNKYLLIMLGLALIFSGTDVLAQNKDVYLDRALKLKPVETKQCPYGIPLGTDIVAFMEWVKANGAQLYSLSEERLEKNCATASNSSKAKEVCGLLTKMGSFEYEGKKCFFHPLFVDFDKMTTTDIPTDMRIDGIEEEEMYYVVSGIIGNTGSVVVSTSQMNGNNAMERVYFYNDAGVWRSYAVILQYTVKGENSFRGQWGNIGIPERRGSSGINADPALQSQWNNVRTALDKKHKTGTPIFCRGDFSQYAEWNEADIAEHLPLITQWAQKYRWPLDIRFFYLLGIDISEYDLVGYGSNLFLSAANGNIPYLNEDERFSSKRIRDQFWVYYFDETIIEKVFQEWTAAMVKCKADYQTQKNNSKKSLEDNL